MSGSLSRKARGRRAPGSPVRSSSPSSERPPVVFRPRRWPSDESPPAPLRAIARRRSQIAGWGVYALESIAKNARIVDYAGELISHRESRTRQERQVACGRIWCFTVNNRWIRDAEVGGNIARFLNHSCRPNCYTQVVGHVIWIRAARNIRRGEELTYDYNTGGDADIACQCRPGCQGRL